MDGTVKEMKAKASEAANKAVELLDKEECSEQVKAYVDKAIEAAAKAEAATKKEEVKEAAEEAVKAAEEAQKLLTAPQTNENAEDEEETEGGEENATEGEEEAENDMSEEETTQEEEPQEEEAPQVNEHSTEDKGEEVKQYVYVGPTISRLGMRENAIYYGTLSSVKEHLKAAIKEKPDIEKMLFPIEKLNVKNRQKKEKGNYIHNVYEALKK